VQANAAPPGPVFTVIFYAIPVALVLAGYGVLTAIELVTLTFVIRRTPSFRGAGLSGTCFAVNFFTLPLALVAWRLVYLVLSRPPAPGGDKLTGLYMSSIVVLIAEGIGVLIEGVSYANSADAPKIDGLRVALMPNAVRAAFVAVAVLLCWAFGV
jgi:hypothetical protein